jgi:hypothetical protein
MDLERLADPDDFHRDSFITDSEILKDKGNDSSESGNGPTWPFSVKQKEE